jgi:hypothetical protein
MKFSQDQAERIKRERDEAVRLLLESVKHSSAKKPAAPTQAQQDERREFLRGIGEEI